MKTQILAAIGEKELQPAARLNAALAANDRVKYAFSLLQMALAHAEHPEQPAATLKRERIACGIDDPGSRHRGGGSAHGREILPRARRRADSRAHRGRHAFDGRARARHEARRDSRRGSSGLLGGAARRRTTICSIPTPFPR